MKLVVVSVMLRTVKGRKFRSLGGGTRKKKKSLKEINVEERIILKNTFQRG
jgi:hypothetical protein